MKKKGVSKEERKMTIEREEKKALIISSTQIADCLFIRCYTLLTADFCC